MTDYYRGFIYVTISGDIRNVININICSMGFERKKGRKEREEKKTANIYAKRVRKRLTQPRPRFRVVTFLFCLLYFRNST